MMIRTLFVLLACTLSLPSLAQSMYKCTENGKVAYSDRPCPEGKPVQLNVPAGSPTEASAARERSRREQDVLRQMELQRVKSERQAEYENRRSEYVATMKRQRCEQLRQQRQRSREQSARTYNPAAEAAKLRARRDAEELAAECPD